MNIFSRVLSETENQFRFSMPLKNMEPTWNNTKGSQFPVTLQAQKDSCSIYLNRVFNQWIHMAYSWYSSSSSTVLMGGGFSSGSMSYFSKIPLAIKFKSWPIRRTVFDSKQPMHIKDRRRPMNLIEANVLFSYFKQFIGGVSVFLLVPTVILSYTPWCSLKLLTLS